MATLNVNELDFFLIKQNIIDYLKLQTEFQDYEFEGSGMNVLMDLLAYATHYMGVYGNMTFNEMFLQTGLLRNSVVSKAIELGYIPNQVTSAIAEVTLTIDLSAEGSPPASIVIPQNTKFSGRNKNDDTFTFITPQSYTIYDVGGQIYQGNVYLVEGSLVTETHTWDNNSTDRVLLSNTNVDTQYLVVTSVPDLASTDVTTWQNFNNLILIDADTFAFFWREVEDNQLQIYFGNNVIGKTPDQNTEFTFEYIKSNGEIGNGVSVFSLLSDISGWDLGNWTVTTVTSSAGGSDIESLAEIKHNAPLFFQSQNRAVTETDYLAIVNQYLSNIQAINVWGGEKNDPPKYGSVLISIKPNSGLALTNPQKEYLLEQLENHNVIGITPELVDPEYLYVNITANVKYKKHLTSLTSGELSTVITNAITQHFDDELYLFDTTLRFSEIINVISDADDSIYSNYISIRLYKEFQPSINVSSTYTLNFNNALVAGTVYLTWTNSGAEVMTLIDDSSGLLELYRDGVLVGNTFGTVDYTTGAVVLQNFNPSLSAYQTLQVFATPSVYEIETVQNNIIAQGTGTTVNLSIVS